MHRDDSGNPRRCLTAALRGLLLSCCLWPLVAHAAPVAAPPVFEERELLTENGVAQLQWPDDGDGYEVELRGPDMPTRIVYSGHLPSAHVSGLPNGLYEARVRARDVKGAWSDWSEPARIEVRHHEMGLVWLLLGGGALTFFATVITLLASARARREAQS